MEGTGKGRKGVRKEMKGEEREKKGGKGGVREERGRKEGWKGNEGDTPRFSPGLMPLLMLTVHRN